MSLWAFVPAKHIEKVGALPTSARRLDTGEFVDLAGKDAARARACGWWDLDAIDVPLFIATAEARGIRFTQQELATLNAEVQAALFDRNQKRIWVNSIETKAEIAKGILVERLELRDNPPNMAVNAQAQYLYNREQEMARILYGGGTLDDPGLIDAVIALARAVLSFTEQVPGLEL